jgi:hypothetical protein
MILFDAHAHIYDCFDLDSFILAAFANFTAAAGLIEGDRERIAGFIILTESAGFNYFGQLDSLVEENGKFQWSVTRSLCGSLVISHPAWTELELVLVPGRQIVTKEQLELLALFCDREFEDGMDLTAAVAAVLKVGGIPVCPWGTGKWLGKRGKILSDSFLRRDNDEFFLGDSGVRPSVWPLFAGFRVLDKRGTVLFSGTDPLPVAGEEKRVGSFGGCLPYERIKNMKAPARELKKFLLQGSCQIVPYGRSQHLCSFVKNQLMLRLQ